MSDDLFAIVTRDAAMPAPEPEPEPEPEWPADGIDTVVFGSVPRVRGWRPSW